MFRCRIVEEAKFGGSRRAGRDRTAEWQYQKYAWLFKGFQRAFEKVPKMPPGISIAWQSFPNKEAAPAERISLANLRQRPMPASIANRSAFATFLSAVSNERPALRAVACAASAEPETRRRHALHRRRRSDRHRRRARRSLTGRLGGHASDANGVARRCLLIRSPLEPGGR